MSLHFPIKSRDELQRGKEINLINQRFPEVVLALNIEVTRLTRKKPIDAIKDKSVDAKSSTTYSRLVG